MTIKKATLKDIIENATGYEVSSIKRAKEDEELGRTIIRATAQLTLNCYGASGKVDADFIYCVDTHELMDNEWCIIG